VRPSGNGVSPKTNGDVMGMVDIAKIICGMDLSQLNNSYINMSPSFYAMLQDIIRDMRKRERKLNKRGISTQWKGK
jgi:hypothetical protein